MDEVINLFKEGKLGDYEFRTYVMFMGDDMAKQYLAKALDAIIMETPAAVGEYACSYYAGRVSVWREIKEVINGVNNLLEGKNYDGSSRG